MTVDTQLEQQILQHFLAGEREEGACSLYLFRGVLRAYFQRKGRYLLPIQDVEDLVQETLIRADRALVRRKVDDPPIHNLRAFILRIAERVAIDALRRAAKEPTADPSEPADQEVPPTELPLPDYLLQPDSARDDLWVSLADPASILERREHISAVRQCLEAFPNKHHRERDCLLDWLLRGETLAQLAQRHGYRNANGSTAAKDRAWGKLNECLRKKGIELD